MSELPVSPNMFPPGLAVRRVAPTDNEAVRELFIACQNELLPADAERELRIRLKSYTDSSLMDDLSKPSAYYLKANRHLWVLESQEHEIVAMAAVDAAEDAPGVALLRRLCVSMEFRRKGVATLLSRRAEQWAARRGYSAMRLYVTELQSGAQSLFTKLEYAEIRQEDSGPITVIEMEKALAE